MSVLHSKMHTLLIGKESVYGTAVSATKDIGLVQSFTPSDKREYEKIYAAGSRVTQEIVAGKATFEFDSEIDFQNGRLFEYLIGSVAHATTTDDTKHTFTIATEPPSFTAESSFNASSDRVFIYGGCKLKSMQVSLDTNGILKLKPSVRAQNVDTSTASASAAVVSSLQTLHFKHSSLAVGAAASETSVGKLQSFNMTWDNGMDMVDAAGTYLTQEDVAGNIDITFDFNMAFEDMTQYEIFLGSTTAQQSPTQKSMVINSHNGVNLGSGRREFYAQLNNCVYEEVGTPVQIGQTVFQSFKGSAETYGSNKIYTVDNIASGSW